MRKLINLYNKFPQGLFTVACVSCFIIFATVFINVLLRYIFAKPFHWAEELGGLMLLFLTFLAAAEVSRREAHICSDMVYRKFRGRLKYSVDFLIDACVVVACTIIAWQAYKAAAMAFRLHLSLPSLMGTPLAFPYSLIFAGMALLAVQSLLRIIERIITSGK
jgi:TRAP-type C4-dicarboxylate transport system permease small subunit